MRRSTIFQSLHEQIRRKFFFVLVNKITGHGIDFSLLMSTLRLRFHEKSIRILYVLGSQNKNINYQVININFNIIRYKRQKFQNNIKKNLTRVVKNKVILYKLTKPIVTNMYIQINNGQKKHAVFTNRHECVRNVITIISNCSSLYNSLQNFLFIVLLGVL